MRPNNWGTDSRLTPGTASAHDRETAKEVRETRGVLRHGAWDALFVGLALTHGVLLLTVPSVPLIALGLWWNANTISHNFIHSPFFRWPALNVAFSTYASLLLGLPQQLWRERHLAHHAERPWRWHGSRQVTFELVLVLGLWIALAVMSTAFLLTVYLPGFLGGLLLCHLQGYFEHQRGTTSHYGRLYNLLFFNDGYHVEHHARPGEHWRNLPRYARNEVRISRWPALFRWFEVFSLDGLERLVLSSKALQNYVLNVHEQAIRRLLPTTGNIRRIGVVGGGLYPRTALVLRRLLPAARITVIDTKAEHLETARRFLNSEVEYAHELFEPEPRREFDLIVVPLAFIGVRRKVYQCPPARFVLVHDWLWRPRGLSAVVSWVLLKRVNLVAE